jgi:hypothetical protein
LTCAKAAEFGHLDILKWARANGCRWAASTRDRAAELGYIESDGSLSDESDDDIISADTDDDDDETSE